MVGSIANSIVDSLVIPIVNLLFPSLIRFVSSIRFNSQLIVNVLIAALIQKLRLSTSCLGR